MQLSSSLSTCRPLSNTPSLLICRRHFNNLMRTILIAKDEGKFAEPVLCSVIPKEAEHFCHCNHLFVGSRGSHRLPFLFKYQWKIGKD